MKEEILEPPLSSDPIPVFRSIPTLCLENNLRFIWGKPTNVKSSFPTNVGSAWEYSSTYRQARNMKAYKDVGLFSFFKPKGFKERKRQRKRLKILD